MRHKSETLQCFIDFVNSIETELGSGTVKTLISDNGGEYISDDFKSFCRSKSIQHLRSCPYTPEQNGVSERFNRTIVETAKTMMFQAEVPRSWWPEAVTYSAYVRNRSSTRILPNGISPFERRYEKTTQSQLHSQIWMSSIRNDSQETAQKTGRERTGGNIRRSRRRRNGTPNPIEVRPQNRDMRHHDRRQQDGISVTARGGKNITIAYIRRHDSNLRASRDYRHAQESADRINDQPRDSACDAESDASTEPHDNRPGVQAPTPSGESHIIGRSTYGRPIRKQLTFMEEFGSMLCFITTDPKNTPDISPSNNVLQQ